MPATVPLQSVPIQKRAVRLQKRVTSFDLDEHELVTLDRACSVLDQIDEMERDVKTRGAVVRGIRGGIGPNPCLKEIRAAEASFLALVRSLSLAPDEMPAGSRSSAARAMNQTLSGVVRVRARSGRP